MKAIVTTGLTKDYGNGRGLFDLDLEVREGEVFGFLGPNGAGKSTTIRLLMDMIRPTRGSARLLGLDAHEDSVALKKSVGYLPGELPDFGRMRCAEIIGYVMGMRRIDATDRVGQLCDRFAIDLSPRFQELSRGNKQKMGLLLSFAHDPHLLILDEPTGGLDPLMQQQFYELVRETRERGGTVFLSSHVLSEVGEICERAAIVREGRLAQVIELSDLHEIRLRHIEIVFAQPPDEHRLRQVPGIEDVVVDRTFTRCVLRGSFEPLADALAGMGVLDLTSHEPTLEETFLDVYLSEHDG